MRLVFDLEADGLLPEVSQIWCIVAKDIDTGEVFKFEPDSIRNGIVLLSKAEVLIGHNIINYDIPTIQKLYPDIQFKEERSLDTLVLTRLAFPHIVELDRGVIKIDGLLGATDKTLIGRHSLKAWGVRLGLHKQDFAGGFESFSQEMLEYNCQDVEVTHKLYDFLMGGRVIALRPIAQDSVLGSDALPPSVILEHRVAHIIQKQEKTGIGFDSCKAEELVKTLQLRINEVRKELQQAFPPWEVTKVVQLKKSVKEKKEKVIFNPGSRQHIANRLQTLFKWQPTQFTPCGSPKIDEKILERMDFPEAKLLYEYLMIQKRLGMLSDGDNAWLALVNNGRIYGEVITNGAVTGRATHRRPNITQVPSNKKEYGKECRELFIPSKGRVLVGADVSGLELRTLAHYLYRYDNGAYGRAVLEAEDIHEYHRELAGLETRDQAKTFIYAFIYGAGATKLGSIIRKDSSHGQRLKDRFLEKNRALAQLIHGLRRASTRGYLVGLDGRHLFIRSDHSALNTLLQSAGALICKQWMIEANKKIIEAGLSDKVAQAAWIHDELQFEADRDVASDLGTILVDSIASAQQHFNINISLTGSFKIGESWADTH